jgi:hypothetical protein
MIVLLSQTKLPDSSNPLSDILGAVHTYPNSDGVMHVYLSLMKEIVPFDVIQHKDVVITNHQFSMRDFPNGLGGEFACVEKRL